MEKHVGVVGCGSWGQHIVRDLSILGCEVSVVARSEASRARAISGGATSIVEAPAELVGVDGVIVATPTSVHAASVESVAKLDVPIFCEKPLTDDPESAAALAKAFGDRLFVMDKWRYHPGVEMLRDIAMSGRIGEVLSLRLRRLGWSNPHEDVDAAWILLPHDLSIFLEILGELPDIASAVGFGTDGAVRTASVHGYVGDVAVTSEISTESLHRDRSIAMYGTAGSATLTDSLADHIAILPLSVPFGAHPDPEKVPISLEYPLLRELRTFVEYLGGGPEPRTNATDAAAAVSKVARVRTMIGVGVADG